MMFRTMALEEPDMRILNYAPGPLDTEMQQIARTDTKDSELKQLFQGKQIQCCNLKVLIALDT